MSTNRSVPPDTRPSTEAQESPAGLATCPYDLVDCDVHPLMAEGMSSLRPFHFHAGQRRLGLDSGRTLTTTGHREAVSVPPNTLFVNSAGVLRSDANSPEGAAPGADPAHTAHQLLDGYGIDRAVLIGGEVLGLGALPDPDNAALIATAYNDWLAATWLSADSRYRGTITVGACDPEQAAAEVRRCAADKRFVAVLLPMTDVLLGQRQFYPSTKPPPRPGRRSRCTRTRAKGSSGPHRRGLAAARDTTWSGTPGSARSSRPTW